MAMETIRDAVVRSRAFVEMTGFATLPEAEELQVVDYWLKKRKFYGIGEIGIDLYWDKSFLEEQIHAFRFQLELARQYQLPVVIHVRDSFDEVYNVLLDVKDNNLKGVFR